MIKSLETSPTILILYGQDADVLGRPLNYVGGGKVNQFLKLFSSPPNK